MPPQSEYTDYVLEQLGALPALRARRLFGGTGIYSEDVFFAIIADDSLYFKVDDRNRERYTSRGMQAFRPYAARPEVSMTYFEVPPETIEDAAELVQWARASIEVSLATKNLRRQDRALKRRRAPRRP